MKQIKASEIKPGMTIRWGEADITHQCPLASVERFNNDQDIQGETPQGQVALLRGDDDVLVVKEPPQPEEPTEFGARVVAGGVTALRTQDGADEVDPDEGPWRVRSACNTWDDMTWAEVCALGPVQVVPDQGWTVPDA